MTNIFRLIGLTIFICFVTSGLFAQQGRRDGDQPRNVSFNRYETVQVGSAAFNTALGRNTQDTVPYVLIESGRAHDNSVHYYLYYMGYVNFVPLAHSGGVGGYGNNAGSVGGNGSVIIVVKYYE